MVTQLFFEDGWKFRSYNHDYLYFEEITSPDGVVHKRSKEYYRCSPPFKLTRQEWAQSVGASFSVGRYIDVLDENGDADTIFVKY